MPTCGVGSLCVYPELQVIAGHICRQCDQLVHVLCATEIESVLDNARNLMCIKCSPPNKPPPSLSVPTAKSSAKKKATPTAKKGFQLCNDKRKIDPLLMKAVAFDINDKGYGSILAKHFGGSEALAKALFDGIYLRGTIVRLSSCKTTKSLYEVQWENSGLGETPIELGVLIPAMDLAKKIKKKGSRESASKQSVNDPFASDIRRLIFEVDDLEDCDVADTDSEDSPNEEEDLDQSTIELLSDFSKTAYFDNRNGTISDFKAEDEAEETEQTGFHWLSFGNLPPPPEFSQGRKSFIKPQYENMFNSPLGSLMAFLPLKLFVGITKWSNDYAHDIMGKTQQRVISGIYWREDITLPEMMMFWGILLKMALRPTPGQSYDESWQDPNWHPYTKDMSISRFRQIRAVLHLSDTRDRVLPHDALHKVRPLLNTIKITFGHYLMPGTDLCLDEASIGSKSRYGRNLIVYAKDKPKKYHFRVYMVCDSETAECLRVRVHTKNNSDTADGPSQDEMELDGDNANGAKNNCDDDEMPKTASSSKLINLCLDLLKPYYGSGRVLNTDNFYSSPKLAIALRERKIFLRGTCRSNRIGFPKGVMFTRTEADKAGRGCIKRMVDETNGIVAYGWVDGNPVHLITTADGTEVGSVTRQIRNEKVVVRAPVAVKRYNQGMGGVDTHDQLRETFSIANRHGFKKYFIKLGLGLVDMAITNAWIHFDLVRRNGEKGKKKIGRYAFMDALANGMINGEYNNHQHAGSTNDGIVGLFCGLPSIPPELPPMNETVCQPIAVKDILDSKRNRRFGLACQVCLFEGRGPGKVGTVVVCLRHRLRCCTKAHQHVAVKDETGKEVTDYSWRAESGSCWNKAHMFYIPRGLFKDNVSALEETDFRTSSRSKFQGVDTTSEIYKNKRNATGKPPHKRRRQSKNCQNAEDGGSEVEEG